MILLTERVRAGVAAYYQDCARHGVEPKATGRTCAVSW